MICKFNEGFSILRNEYIIHSSFNIVGYCIERRRIALITEDAEAVIATIFLSYYKI
jgi:hypothetical protein